jgi:hypothetical protein
VDDCEPGEGGGKSGSTASAPGPGEDAERRRRFLPSVITLDENIPQGLQLPLYLLVRDFIRHIEVVRKGVPLVFTAMVTTRILACSRALGVVVALRGRIRVLY